VFSDEQVEPEDLVVVPTAGDVAYTLSTEHGQAKLADESIRIDWRATNIYRREAGGWKILHHHTDVSPALVETLGRLEGRQGQEVAGLTTVISPRGDVLRVGAISASALFSCPYS
jgi:hypothetical protein